MKWIKILRIITAASGLAACTAGSADAGLISYEYKTTLSLASGSDALGLDGAVVDIKVDVSSTAVYGTMFEDPEVAMNDDATITISGSSQASNNVTLALPQLAFYATFAGLFAVSDGYAQHPTLPVGGSISTQINTIPTTHGSAVAVGDTVNISDFGPTTSVGYQFTGSDGAFYDEVNPTVIVTMSSVPEPRRWSLLESLAL